MTRRRLRVAVVHTSDYESFPRGGGISIIRAILEHAPIDRFDFTLFGIGRSETEDGASASHRTIGTHTFPFVPLYSRRPEDVIARRPLVPLRVASFLQYLRRRELFANHDVLYLHAPEAWPLLRYGVPSVYHVHGPQEDLAAFSRFRWVRSGIFQAIFQRLIRDVVRRSTRLLFIHPATLADYAARFPEHASRFRLCPPTIDTTRFGPVPRQLRDGLRRGLGLAPTDPVLLAVGRLRPVKGFDRLLRAMAPLAARQPNLHLLIAGDGEGRPALAALAGELGLSSRVRFLGPVASAAMPDYYRAADLLVVSSQTESFGLVMLEALACGVPVVTPKVGIADDVIVDGRNGYVIADGNPETLGRAIDAGLSLATAPGVHGACIAAVARYAAPSDIVFEALEEAAATFK